MINFLPLPSPHLTLHVVLTCIYQMDPILHMILAMDAAGFVGTHGFADACLNWVLLIICSPPSCALCSAVQSLALWVGHVTPACLLWHCCFWTSGLNPAFQATLHFEHYQFGKVNRAFRKCNSVGGKGKTCSLCPLGHWDPFSSFGWYEVVAIWEGGGGGVVSSKEESSVILVCGGSTSTSLYHTCSYADSVRSY